MCQGKRSIYNINKQDLSRKINYYPGICARFILVKQELPGTYYKFYPGISRIILELEQDLSWYARIILEFTTSFVLEYQELSRYDYNMFSPGVT